MRADVPRVSWPAHAQYATEMSVSFNSPINRWLTPLVSFVVIASGGTCQGAEPEEVLAVYTNRVVPGLLFLAAVIWFVVAAYCLFRSPAGRDALRFFAGLAFLAGLFFGWAGMCFVEKLEVTGAGLHFSYWEDGRRDVRISFKEIYEVVIERPKDGSHRYAPYLRYHHRWRIDRQVDRRLWFIDTKEKEDALIGVLAEHGVRVRDNRRGWSTGFSEQTDLGEKF